jgi:hypothetical protein
LEEVRRSIALVALTAFSSCYFVPFSEANVCVGHKIKTAQACGFVVDRFGEPIPNVDVNFYYDIDTIPTKTDAHGFFERTDLPHAKIWLIVSARGFFSVSQTVELLAKPTKGCKLPLYVMLDFGSSECGSVISTKKSDLPIAKRD